MTDANNTELYRASGGRLVPTPCEPGHSKPELCCKLEHEVRHFYEQRQAALARHAPADEWFCHVDDDMYLLVGNLRRLLARYDPKDRVLLGPTNLWPDDTAHDPRLGIPPPSKLHHPMNGAYCMSATLVDAVYPEHMAQQRFAASCTQTPDDVTLPDLIHRVTGVTMQIENGFHHQHSRNYKLPLFDAPRLAATAVTLYGFEDLPRLHSILRGGAAGEPWWRTAAELTIIPPRGKRISLGYNFCRRVHLPPNSTAARQIDAGRTVMHGEADAGVHRWCGPPVRAPAGLPLEPLCESRRTYKETHSSHKHTATSESQCPYTHPSITQGFGTPTTIVPPALAVAFAEHRTVAYQFDRRKSSTPLWAPLAQSLAAAGTPGTCCVSNPAVPEAEGGLCYWTAADQSRCAL